jgi:Exonuclease
MHSYYLRSKNSVVGQGSSLPCNIQQPKQTVTEGCNLVRPNVVQMNVVDTSSFTNRNESRDVSAPTSLPTSLPNSSDLRSTYLSEFASNENSLPHPYYTLIFDTETTGLFSTYDITSAKLNEYPYMIQLAYELLDESTGNIVESYNSYIQLSDSIEINTQIQQITGITKEKLHEQGIPVSDALVSFYHAYFKSKRVVAHNISFDIKMIQVEIMRNYASMREKGCPFPENIFNPVYEHIQNRDLFCTMKHGLKITDIWKRSYK